MSSVSFKGDEKMREFIDFLRNNEINKYICLPGKFKKNFVIQLNYLICYGLFHRDCCHG